MMKIPFFVSILVCVSAQSFCDGEREFEKILKKAEIEFESEVKGESCKDVMRFELKVLKNEGTEVRMEYKGSKSDNKARFRFRQKTFKVHEFEDNNNNNVVDEGEVVQSLPIGGDNWILSAPEENVSGAKVLTGTAQSGWFKQVIRYAGSPVSFKATNNNTENTYELNPRAVKMDILITGFPYKNTSTKLAVEGRFKSMGKFKAASPSETSTDDDIEVGDDSPEAVRVKFAWVKTVMADGESVPVVASPLVAVSAEDDEETLEKAEDGEENKRLMWVFDTTKRVDEFEWDPTVEGLTGSTESAASMMVPSFVLAFILLSFF
jgi:hypothetical protein